MTVKELIETLQGMPEDKDVYVYADHGQTTMKAAGAGVDHICKEDAGKWSIDTVIAEDDLGEYDAEDVTTVVTVWN